VKPKESRCCLNWPRVGSLGSVRLRALCLPNLHRLDRFLTEHARGAAWIAAEAPGGQGATKDQRLLFVADGLEPVGAALAAKPSASQCGSTRARAMSFAETEEGRFEGVMAQRRLKALTTPV
jgi:hypothetical protein